MPSDDDSSVNDELELYADTNGNVITASASGACTDAMGVEVLTILGAAPNAVLSTYTDSNEKSQPVMVSYVSYTSKSHSA